jgi:hypothetical protein
MKGAFSFDRSFVSKATFPRSPPRTIASYFIGQITSHPPLNQLPAKGLRLSRKVKMYAKTGYSVIPLRGCY